MLTLVEQLLTRVANLVGRDFQKLAIRLAPFAVLALTIYWLVPRFSFRDYGSLSADKQEEIRRFVGNVKESVAQSQTPSKSASPQGTMVPFRPTCIDCTDYFQGAVALTPLVNLHVKIPVEISGNNTAPAGYTGIVGSPEYYPTLRLDNIVLASFIFVGLILGLRALRAPTIKMVNTGTPVLSVKTSAEEFLEADVEGAAERARDIYRRSTILLGGGIIMAFVGVALFYVTLPSAGSAVYLSQRERDYRDYIDQLQSRVRGLELEREYFARSRPVSPSERAIAPQGDSLPFQPSSENPWLTFASHSLRPTGMLIFMEGIAWFLLRQYRVLIEEYKSFLRVYLKRSSYLIAWKAAATIGAEKQIAIAHAMIRDEMGDTLKKNETTEALEVMKIEEPPPVIAILREVKELLPKLNKPSAGRKSK
ncbi:MAG TPA: hypothetical protein VGH51_10545 [Candidatus Angelobacter sp.]